MKNTLKVVTRGEREIVITRDFNAPRPLVWDAMRQPEFVRRWLQGPPGWKMTACDDDQRVGGEFKWAWVGPEGQEMVIKGVNKEVVPPERVVRTETFEVGCAPQAGEQLATLELADHGATTSMTITIIYPSKEARDGAVASGMEKGMAFNYERLDVFLATNPSKPN